MAKFGCFSGKWKVWKKHEEDSFPRLSINLFWCIVYREKIEFSPFGEDLFLLYASRDGKWNCKCLQYSSDPLFFLNSSLVPHFIFHITSKNTLLQYLSYWKNISHTLCTTMIKRGDTILKFFIVKLSKVNPLWIGGLLEFRTFCLHICHELIIFLIRVCVI